MNLPNQKGVCVRLTWLAFLCFLLLASGSPAESFSARPALTNYTYAVDMGTWCGKGLAERRLALGSSSTILPACDSQQHFLQTWNSAVKGVIPSYVDMGEAIGGAFDAWFSSHSSSNSFPTLTVTGLLIRCGLSVSYLDTLPPWLAKSDNPDGWPAARRVLTNLIATAAISSSITNGLRTYEDESLGSSYRSSLVSGYERCSVHDDTINECSCSDEQQSQSEDVEGFDVDCCAASNTLYTTNDVTSYGLAVTYDRTCEKIDRSSESAWKSLSGDLCGLGPGYVCIEDGGEASSSEKSSSLSLSSQRFSGDAFSPAVSGLVATVDFYEKCLSTGPSAETNICVYPVADGDEDTCDNDDPTGFYATAGVALRTATGTNVVVIDLTVGIDTSNWHRTQSKVKQRPASGISFAVNYSIPTLAEQDVGSYTYHGSGSAACPSLLCGDATASMEEHVTYVKRVVRWRGYTPQAPWYLFRWDFDYE